LTEGDLLVDEEKKCDDKNFMKLLVQINPQRTL